jgi:hypothetical protein
LVALAAILATLVSAPSAAAPGPAVPAARQAVLSVTESTAVDRAMEQSPCGMSTMDAEVMVLPGGPDVCAPLRDACARGGDCSMYMCCQFGEAFCMTGVTPLSDRPPARAPAIPA